MERSCHVFAADIPHSQRPVGHILVIFHAVPYNLADGQDGKDTTYHELRPHPVRNAISPPLNEVVEASAVSEVLRKDVRTVLRGESIEAEVLRQQHPPQCESSWP